MAHGLRSNRHYKRGIHAGVARGRYYREIDQRSAGREGLDFGDGEGEFEVLASARFNSARNGEPMTLSPSRFRL